jgi:flagellar biosynthesis/type III secretory pathway protein FliH
MAANERKWTQIEWVASTEVTQHNPRTNGMPEMHQWEQEDLERDLQRVRRQEMPIRFQQEFELEFRKGYRLGYRKGLRRGVRQALEFRFTAPPECLVARLEAIEDAEVLQLLLQEALSVDSLSVFRAALARYSAA